MSKELILAKSNFRKNKGTTIGIFLLILMAAMLTSLALLVSKEVKPTAEKEAKRLNAGDGYIVAGTEDPAAEETIRDIIKDDVEEYQFTECIYYAFSQPLPFGDGEISPSLVISATDRFNGKIDRVEIVKEDTGIEAPYIYLPYQFNTSGGFEVGDTYSFELSGVRREYKIRGFINTTYFGCNNSGTYEFIPDDDSYAELKEYNKGQYESVLVNFILKDGVKIGKFNIRSANDYVAAYPEGSIMNGDLDSALSDKTFMSDILTISFLMVTVIIIVVTSLMLSNSIKNYIRENMTNLGALKAMGYTGKDIKNSLVLMFGGLALIGGIIGGLLSYLLVPVMAGVFEGQSGVPYKAKINAIITVFTVLFIAAFTVIVTLFAARRLKKVEVVTALRDGMESHNFKKNHMPLEKTSLSLNSSLAFKTLFTNLKQNITTFFVTGILVFICVIGLLMYENFNRNPMLEILTFETCGGVVGVKQEYAPEVEEFIKEQDEAEHVRYLINGSFIYNEEETLCAYILRDVNGMNNKTVVYKGRLPEYDNEIAVSGKFADNYGFEIGDEVELSCGDKSFAYLITGLMQSCNNGGREAMMSEDAASHIIDMNTIPAGIWFDCDNSEESEEILNAITEKFGDKLETSLNFYDTIEGALTTFKSITVIMLTLMLAISATVIMLILYLFIKSLLYNKKKDYGIYKAIGYTSKDLILQTAASFMPTIILSVAVFSVLSYLTANKYMSLIMATFGMMKCNFAIPIGGVVIIGLGMIILSFVFAMLQARKIKNIEAYNMLTEA